MFKDYTLILADQPSKNIGQTKLTFLVASKFLNSRSIILLGSIQTWYIPGHCFEYNSCYSAGKSDTLPDVAYHLDGI